MTGLAATPGVVSLQSHVAYGHVGNAVAVFALQRLGQAAWPVHSVHFSNHPGYGDHAGAAREPAAVAATVAALDRRGALAVAPAVLTGYLPAAALVEEAARAIDLARSRNPGVLCCCDPVLGDRETGLYVPAEVLPAIREALVPRADLLVPNVFELELLSGVPAPGRQAVVAAARALLSRGPGRVVVTGCAPDAGGVEALAIEAGAAWAVRTPRVELGRRPDGAGDLLAALLVARLVRGEAFVDALAGAAAAVHDVLAHTRAAGRRELALVEAQALLAEPACKPAVRRIR